MWFLLENLRYALRALWQHQLRSFLTMLGVIFGVAAVIAMLSIGKGAEQEAIEQISSFGINNIRIYAKELDSETQAKAERTASVGLSPEDAQYIRQVLPYVVAIAPQNLLDKKVYYRQLNPAAQVVGTTPEYLDVNVQHVAQGRFLNQDDLVAFRKVCVLSHELSQELFLHESPLGQWLTIGGVRVRVVGILSQQQGIKQKVDIKSRPTSRDIYIPITTSLRKFTLTEAELNPRNSVRYNVVDEIALRIRSAELLTQARQDLTHLLNRRHASIPDYEIIVPTELLEQSQQTQRLFNLVMACIAGLSLLVGGIGIMNIMLATVTERTREIGIRRAIGASPGDIMVLFVLESLVISLVGGLLGIGTGIALSALVSFYAGWKTIIVAEALLLSFGVSSAVGIFFGIYPAWRAAKMDPIQALRHE